MCDRAKLKCSALLASVLFLPAAWEQPKPAPAKQTGRKAEPVEPQIPEATEPERTLVWVDHATGRFYRKSHPHYGRGKTGEFMDERDAVKAGLREAKPGRRR